MNRRWFFGLLAAVALLPKRAAGQLKYTCYTFVVGKAYRCGARIPRPTNKTDPFAEQCERHEIIGGPRFNRRCQWVDTHKTYEFPVRFRKSLHKTSLHEPLGDGSYWLHEFKWHEKTA